MFEVPYINKRLFVKDARKIVLSLQLSVNSGTGIIFNMTPSPGATSCLGNAERDVELVCDYLGKTFHQE